MALTAEQADALRQAVKARAQTDAALADAYARKDCEAIAALMSVGRTKHGPTQIGAGTVIAVLGDPNGGVFLDDLTSLGQTDRTVYWGMDSLRRGALDLSVPAAVASMVTLKDKLPAHADDIDKLLQIGVVNDPLQVADVHLALFEPDGTPL